MKKSLLWTLSHFNSEIIRQKFDILAHALCLLLNAGPVRMRDKDDKKDKGETNEIELTDWKRVKGIEERDKSHTVHRKTIKTLDKEYKYVTLYKRTRTSHIKIRNIKAKIELKQVNKNFLSGVNNKNKEKERQKPAKHFKLPFTQDSKFQKRGSTDIEKVNRDIEIY